MKSVWLCTFWWIFSLLGMDIGSDTAVTRFNTQVVVNDGDRIAGFAALDGGFFFTSANVTATFDSFFQVSGPVALNGGTLVLSQDLIISNTATVDTLGNIQANFHTIDLSHTITMLPQPVSGNPCELIFKDDATGADPFETVDWAFDNEYIAVGTSGFFPNLIIYEFDGAALTQVEIVTPPGFSFDVNVVRWRPEEYYVAIGQTLAFFGSELHIYSFNPGTTTLTLVSSSGLAGAVTALAWHPSGDYLVVGTDINGGELELYPVSAGGVLGAPVSVNITPDRDVQLESLDFDASGDYFAVGLNTSGANPTVLVYDFVPTPLGATLNASALTPSSVAGLSWNQSITNVLAVGQTGVTANRVIAFEHDGGAGTLTSIATISDFSIAVENVAWNDQGTCLALGTVVSSGVGQVRSYCYESVSPAFDVASTFDRAGNVGGIGWSVDSNFLATGDDANVLSVYQKNASVSGTAFTFSDATIVLNNTVQLNDVSLLFSGISSIVGNGHVLDLMGTSTIVVDSDSSLTLRDLYLQGAGPQRISGTDMTSTLSCNNVSWLLDEDFTFTKGNIAIVSQLLLQGEDVQFTYKSDGRMYVDGFSACAVDNGVTFSYDPSVLDKNLLHFVDNTSLLVLTGGRLHASLTGLNLYKGALLVDNDAVISNDATSDAQAIMFGDGVSAANNFIIDVEPAALACISSGRVVFNNV